MTKVTVIGNMVELQYSDTAASGRLSMLLSTIHSIQSTQIGTGLYGLAVTCAGGREVINAKEDTVLDLYKKLRAAWRKYLEPKAPL